MNACDNLDGMEKCFEKDKPPELSKEETENPIFIYLLEKLNF